MKRCGREFCRNDVKDPRNVLWEVCQQFINQYEVSCPENIYQSDRVVLNAQQFIEEICNIVGYAEVKEDD